MTPQSKIRILVVDDTELARKEICRILTNLGYTNIETGDDGLRALHLLKQGVESGQPFKLVICDWAMPNVTGLDVLKEIRKDATLLSPAFIMVTAEAGLANVVEALNLGASDYVIKPVAPSLLQKKIERIVSRLAL